RERVGGEAEQTASAGPPTVVVTRRPPGRAQVNARLLVAPEVGQRNESIRCEHGRLFERRQAVIKDFVEDNLVAEGDDIACAGCDCAWSEPVAGAVWGTAAGPFMHFDGIRD